MLKLAQMRLSHGFKQSEQGRIEAELANATTQFLMHHGSLPSQVVDQIFALVFSDKGMEMSMTRLEMFVRFCVESLIYTQNAETCFERFKKMPDRFKIRLVVFTNLPDLFEATHEKRSKYLEHLRTIQSGTDEWNVNLSMIELHHELLNTNGRNIEACDELVMIVIDRLLSSTVGSDCMSDNIDDTEEFSHLKLRIGRDLMRQYLKTNKIEQAQALVDMFEYVLVKFLRL